MTFTKDITIYDVPINATNGEVIQALFPNITFTKERNCVGVKGMDCYNHHFDIKWWNTPYQKGE